MKEIEANKEAWGMLSKGHYEHYKRVLQENRHYFSKIIESDIMELEEMFDYCTDNKMGINYGWMYKVSDIINSLAKAGLTIEFFLNTVKRKLQKMSCLMKFLKILPKQKRQLDILYQITIYIQN